MSKATSDLLSHFEAKKIEGSPFEAKKIEGSPPGPSWNVAPTQNVLIVAERLDEGTIDRRLMIAKWGPGAVLVKGHQNRVQNSLHQLIPSAAGGVPLMGVPLLRK